jgi:hypothetical protein
MLRVQGPQLTSVPHTAPAAAVQGAVSMVSVLPDVQAPVEAQVPMLHDRVMVPPHCPKGTMHAPSMQTRHTSPVGS